MTIPIITSIPPRLSRHDRDGREIGEEYQSACIDSWWQQGFTVHSVNARSELEGMVRRPGVTYWEVDRDASAIIGRPLIWFDDLIRMCGEIADGPFLFTNADIILRPSGHFFDATASLRPGSALISKRIDIQHPSLNEGTPCWNGYDLFGLHREDVSAIEDANLIFGSPWCDYMVPYALMIRNIKLGTFPGRPAYHLAHKERWAKAEWINRGMSYWHFVRRTSNKSPPRFREIVRQIEDKKPPALRRILRLHEKTIVKSLAKLAFATVDSVDSASNMDVYFRNSTTRDKLNGI